MEVHRLKERASQLACPGSQGAVPVVDHMIYTIAFMTERRIDVLALNSGEQAFETIPGGCQ